MEKRVRGVKITPHNKKIQDFPLDFYIGFRFVVCGLDSLEARSYINEQLVALVGYDHEANPLEDTMRPLIDGGTEGEED